MAATVRRFCGAGLLKSGNGVSLQQVIIGRWLCGALPKLDCVWCVCVHACIRAALCLRVFEEKKNRFPN